MLQINIENQSHLIHVVITSEQGEYTAKYYQTPEELIKLAEDKDLPVDKVIQTLTNIPSDAACLALQKYLYMPNTLIKPLCDAEQAQAVRELLNGSLKSAYSNLTLKLSILIFLKKLSGNFSDITLPRELTTELPDDSNYEMLIESGFIEACYIETNDINYATIAKKTIKIVRESRCSEKTASAISLFKKVFPSFNNDLIDTIFDQLLTRIEKDLTNNAKPNQFLEISKILAIVATNVKHKHIESFISRIGQFINSTEQGRRTAVLHLIASFASSLKNKLPVFIGHTMRNGPWPNNLINKLIGLINFSTYEEPFNAMYAVWVFAEMGENLRVLESPEETFQCLLIQARSSAFHTKAGAIIALINMYPLWTDTQIEEMIPQIIDAIEERYGKMRFEHNMQIIRLLRTKNIMQPEHKIKLINWLLKIERPNDEEYQELSGLISGSNKEQFSKIVFKAFQNYNNNPKDRSKYLQILKNNLSTEQVSLAIDEFLAGRLGYTQSIAVKCNALQVLSSRFNLKNITQSVDKIVSVFAEQISLNEQDFHYDRDVIRNCLSILSFYANLLKKEYTALIINYLVTSSSSNVNLENPKHSSELYQAIISFAKQISEEEQIIMLNNLIAIAQANSYFFLEQMQVIATLAQLTKTQIPEELLNIFSQNVDRCFSFRENIDPLIAIAPLLNYEQMNMVLSKIKMASINNLESRCKAYSTLLPYLEPEQINSIISSITPLTTKSRGYNGAALHAENLLLTIAHHGYLREVQIQAENTSPRLSLMLTLYEGQFPELEQIGLASIPGFY